MKVKEIVLWIVLLQTSQIWAQDPAQENWNEFQAYFQNSPGGRPESLYRVIVENTLILPPEKIQALPEEIPEGMPTLQMGEIVSIQEFGEPKYPGWVKIGRREWVRASDLESLGKKTPGLP